MSSLLKGHWSTRNRERLEQLLSQPRQGDYAVFDWDNTCVFLDVEEATLAYQLERMAFAADPSQMLEALRRELPDDPEVRAHLSDIETAYQWLWPRYNSLLQRGQFEAITGSHAHHGFRAKFLNLYSLLEHRYGPELAYPWMPFRYVGMNTEQIRRVTAEAVRWQMTQPIESVTWSSPQEGEVGAIEVSWRSGLRLLPEIQSLQQALTQLGIDVWVCTASFVEGIREIASNPEFRYGVAAERVIGLQLEQDSEGRYLAQRKAGSEITYAAGKTEAVQRHLVSCYGRGPILVAGDSNGDAPMLRDFADTEVSLIIDTSRPADSPIGQLALLASQGDSRYLLQARDELRGCWCNADEK